MKVFLVREKSGNFKNVTGKSGKSQGILDQSRKKSGKILSKKKLLPQQQDNTIDMNCFISTHKYNVSKTRHYYRVIKTMTPVD